jgi:hypothetical protein
MEPLRLFGIAPMDKPFLPGNAWEPVAQSVAIL